MCFTTYLNLVLLKSPARNTKCFACTCIIIFLDIVTVSKVMPVLQTAPFCVVMLLTRAFVALTTKFSSHLLGRRQTAKHKVYMFSEERTKDNYNDFLLSTHLLEDIASDLKSYRDPPPPLSIPTES